jgi:transposase
MTKAGNTHLRRVFIEAAWSYRYRPAVKGDLERRLEDQDATIQHISWKAQNRLHLRYKHLVYQRGKHKNIAIGAVARELVGFVWAIARLAEQESMSA